MLVRRHMELTKEAGGRGVPPLRAHSRREPARAVATRPERHSRYNVTSMASRGHRDLAGPLGIGILLLIVLISHIYVPPRVPRGPRLDYEAMADRIVASLALEPGETVLMRFDPGHFTELLEPLRRKIRAAGAVDLAGLEYVEIDALNGSSPALDAHKSLAFERLLESADVYIWLPVRFDVRTTPAAERTALSAWLDRGGRRRQVHFHWAQGSVLADGLAGEHTPDINLIYQAALDVDYGAISAAQDRAIELLRSGTVHVTSPAGTDLRFRVGDRPFNKQDGDASPERMQTAATWIDREIELPCGVLRVAPIEESVEGRFVLPQGRFGDTVARNVTFDFAAGRITAVNASEGLAAVEAEIEKGGDAARWFREFGLGFHPGLVAQPGSGILPYFGYGAGVVRMSLGDNEELNGAVRGDYRRWFFFPDTTVEVEGAALVKDGVLQTP